MNRSEIFSSLKQNPNISVLIVGAGINGIGTFRDLAMNGVDVLLIDRADFCSGASSASSHMAHGGIRYLENGEFRLVREAVAERNRLLQNAAHIVKPLPTAIPIFKHFSGILNAPLKFFGKLDRPSERGSIIIKLGLMMYDAYTGKHRTVPKHKFLSRNTSLKKWNQLNADITNTAVYYDGLITNPERLALDLILDSESENPKAHALNYVSMVNGEKDKVILRDELSDDLYEVQPKLLINASGAWIDFSNYNLGFQTKFISGTKGSHIVLNHPELRDAIGENEFFFENKDGRIVLICPLFDRVLIGTSDINIDNPDDAVCTDEEVEYFLSLVKHVFPNINVNIDHIVFRYSGVRPLENSNAKSTSQYSRDHSIQVLSGDWTNLQFPVYSLVGGKWTTFRAFSEEVADKALSFLGIKRIKDTKSMQIGGGRGYPKNQEEKNKFINSLAAWTGLSKERLEILFERYGTRAEAIADFIKRAPDEPLKFLQNYSKREILYLAQHEKIEHLDDLILRRSLLAMLGKLSTQSLLELVSILGENFNWSSVQENDEAERTLRVLENRHRVRL
jgi:glycerol-3-phosphate dehydrogenase